MNCDEICPLTYLAVLSVGRTIPKGSAYAMLSFLSGTALTSISNVILCIAIGMIFETRISILGMGSLFSDLH